METNQTTTYYQCQSNLISQVSSIFSLNLNIATDFIMLNKQYRSLKQKKKIHRKSNQTNPSKD